MDIIREIEIKFPNREAGTIRVTRTGIALSDNLADIAGQALPTVRRENDRSKTIMHTAWEESDGRLCVIAYDLFRGLENYETQMSKRRAARDIAQSHGTGLRPVAS